MSNPSSVPKITSRSVGPIALNGRFTGTRLPTGTQTAAFYLLDAILRSDREFEFVIFADSRFGGVEEWKKLPKVNWIEVPFQNWSRIQAQLWELLLFPWLARQAGCVLCHHPINTSPLWDNSMAHVVTLHDLNFLTHPEWYDWTFRNFLRFVSAPRLSSAQKIVVVSEYVRRQALAHLPVESRKIEVVYNGVKPAPVRQSPAISAPETTARRYLLCVGSLQPHKNLPRLIRAFRLLREEGLVDELKIVGRPQKNFSKIPELDAMSAEPGLHFTGYLNETALFQTYSESAVFCYPSLEEGFGLPVLEAMLSRTLVVTSNLSCLPEIAGPGAILVNPYSVEEIAAGIRDSLRLTPEQRAQRLDASESWARNFTWQKASASYLKIYHDVLGG